MFNLPSLLMKERQELLQRTNFIKTGDIVKINFKSFQYSCTEKSTTNKFYLKSFLGLCISSSCKYLASRIKIRNVVLRQSLESAFYIYSPLITELIKYKQKKGFYRSARLFFLRHKALHYSRIKLKSKMSF